MDLQPHQIKSERLEWMTQAIYRAKRDFGRSDEIEYERGLIRSMLLEITRATADLVEACGGDGTYLAVVDDAINEAIPEAFLMAIEERDADLEARRDATERDYSRGDYLRAGRA